MYEPVPDMAQAFSHWSARYSGDSYAYFRLYNSLREGRSYRSAIYAKMPMCIFQFEDEAVGVRFQPVVEDQVPSISVWKDEKGCHFDYTSEVSHVLKTKRTPHLGQWENESVYQPSISALPELQQMRAPTWWQLVREFVEAELSTWNGSPTSQAIRDSLAMANAFHNRIFDALNNVHLETVVPDRPARYGSTIFTHPSFEACRAFSLLGVSSENRPKCDRIVRRLVFDETLSAELKELGPYRAWHNGLDSPVGESVLKGRSTFGTAYAGYPGGMATFLRKLLSYASMTEATDILPWLRQGVDWLVAVQRQDGSYPYTVPTFADSGGLTETVITGPETKALGGAAEAVRALVAAYKLFNDKSYLDAAELAVVAINPVPPYYQFRGYGDLRDASVNETDGTSGIQLASANLDLHEATGNGEYLNLAIMLGYYTLTWHNWWRTNKIDPYGFIDPMADSFSPHISPWNTSLACELYSRFYTATGDKFWQKLAEFCFVRAASLQQASGGISEVYNVKFTEAITIMGGESGMVTWGLIDAGLALLRNRGEEPSSPGTESESREGEPVRDVSVRAVVSVLRPTRSRPNPKTMLRAFKPLLKGMAKTVLGVRAVYKMRGRVVVGAPVVSATRTSGMEETIVFDGPSETKARMHFSVDSIPQGLALRLSTLSHDTRIQRVHMPVIDLEAVIDRVEVASSISKTITALRIYLANGCALRLEFLRGTSGLGINGYEIRGCTLLCDVTLKAGWQFGGECAQFVGLSRVEG